jgi:hypothetical protein
MNSYLLSFLFGLIIYGMMVIDARYIEPNNKPISLKIPLASMLLFWIIYEFVISVKPSPVAIQPIMAGGFYDK